MENKIKKITLRSPLYLLLFLYLIQSCGNKTTHFNIEIEPIILDFSKTLENIHNIGLIDNVEIISLNCRENPNIIIGEICKVVRFDNKLYLLDSRQTQSVFIFDVDRGFVNKISRFGQGPQEYLQLSDIFIDKADSTLNLLGRMDKKIFKYDLEGRELLEIIPTPKAFSSIARTNFGYAGYTEFTQDFNNPHNLWLLGENLEIIGSYLEIKPLFESRSYSNVYNFSSYKENIYYIAPYFDYYIYSIDSEDITVRYVFDLGRLQLPKRVRERANQEILTDLLSQYLTFFNFQETKNHLIVRVLHQYQMRLGVYNKNNKQTHIVRLLEYEGRYLLPFGQIVSFDEETIYAVASADAIRRYWMGSYRTANYEETHPEQVQNLRERFDYIDEEDNPFLIMYSIN